MIPITWPELANLHPYCPTDQVRAWPCACAHVRMCVCVCGREGGGYHTGSVLLVFLPPFAGGM
jgi:hypothetical protein